MKRRLAQGGDVARSVLRELFPNAILMQPDPSGEHLWAEFPAEALHVSLLYGPTASKEEFEVENNGSGGRI
jgi:hypothetical protein